MGELLLRDIVTLQRNRPWRLTSGRLTVLAAWQEVAPYSSRRHPSSRLRGGTLAGKPTWPCALIVEGFPAVAMSLITSGCAA
jgi:hypothetical protein